MYRVGDSLRTGLYVVGNGTNALMQRVRTASGIRGYGKFCSQVPMVLVTIKTGGRPFYTNISADPTDILLSPGIHRWQDSQRNWE